MSLGSTSNMGKSDTLKRDKKIAVYSVRSQCVKNSLRVLAMFGFSLKAAEKPRRRAAAVAFCTGALAVVQPSNWAPLELMMAKEKKHCHSHSPRAKKMLSTTRGSYTPRAAGQLPWFAVPAAPTSAELRTRWENSGEDP